MEANGGMDMETRHRASAAWGNWKKVQCSVVRQKDAREAKGGDMLNTGKARNAGAETRSTTKTQENRLEVKRRGCCDGYAGSRSNIKSEANMSDDQ